jgi:isomerase DpgB
MTPSFSCNIFCVEIDGNGFLSPALVTTVSRVCDRVEDASRSSIVLLHVKGTPNRIDDRCWPGDVCEIDIHLVNQWEQGLRRIERLAAVTIAAAEGVCGGVALEVLLTTDYRLVSTNLSIHLRGPSGEVWPSMALYRLANQVGVARSRQVALFGADVSAIQAAELGLVDEVVDDVKARATSFVESLAVGINADIAVRRRLLLEAAATTFENALGSHLAACDRLMRSIQRLKATNAGNAGTQ